MYFKKFPKINYDVRGDGKLYTMTNLMTKVKFNNLVKTNIVAFDFYDVQDGDTPEIVSFYYYEDVALYWLVLLANNITNVYSQWPMSVPKFEQYVYAKYDDVNAIHHYEIYQSSADTTKIIKISNNVGHPNAVPVTNFVYEDRLQKELSKIRLIRPEYVDQIKREFDNLMSRA